MALIYGTYNPEWPVPSLPDGGLNGSGPLPTGVGRPTPFPRVDYGAQGDGSWIDPADIAQASLGQMPGASIDPSGGTTALASRVDGGGGGPAVRETQVVGAAARGDQPWQRADRSGATFNPENIGIRADGSTFGDPTLAWPNIEGRRREAAFNAGFAVAATGAPGGEAGWGGTLRSDLGVVVADVTVDGQLPTGTNHGWVDVTNVDPKVWEGPGGITEAIRGNQVPTGPWSNPPKGPFPGGPIIPPRGGPGGGVAGAGGGGNGNRSRFARSGEAMRDARFPTFARGGAGAGGRRKLGVRRNRSGKRRGR